MAMKASTEELLGPTDISGPVGRLTRVIYQSLDEEPSVFSWAKVWTNWILKVQLGFVFLLSWLIIALHGCNFPVKTNLNTEYVPFWSLWIVFVFTLSISVSYAFHYHASQLGILIAGILQGMNLGFSAFFISLGLFALEINATLDKNHITRIAGSVIYTSIIAVNGWIALTSLVLIMIALKDVCTGLNPKFVEAI